MGMAIEDCAKMLIAKEKCMERETSGIDTDCNLHNCDDCSLCYEQGTMGEQKEALKFAIETMRKYQKITEILNDWENSGEEDDPINIIDNIEEVLEDGNNSRRCNF